MNPVMSSTPPGSRIKGNLPADTPVGPADPPPFLAAISASACGFKVATFGEFDFCQPEESGASIVIEISAEVCVCQLLSQRELKMPSTLSALEKKPAVVSLCFCAIGTILPTPSARCSGVTAAVSAKWRDGTGSVLRAPSPGAGIGSRS